MDATNNRAERVMRILVMIRKNWGGNRTENGARAQAILSSVLCTARQQDQDVFQLLVDLLRSREPKLLDILPPGIFDTDEIESNQSSNTNVGSEKVLRKSFGPDFPLPACVEALLPHMQPSAAPAILSSG